MEEKQTTYKEILNVPNVSIKVPKGCVPDRSGGSFLFNGHQLGGGQFFNRHYYVHENLIGRTIRATVVIKEKTMPNGKVYTLLDVTQNGSKRSEQTMKLLKNAPKKSGTTILQSPDWQIVFEPIVRD